MESLDTQEQEQLQKRPTSLIVLVVLSLLSIATSGLSTLSALFSKPMTVEQLEHYQAEQYENIAQLESQGMEGIENMLTSMMEMTIYQNNEIYYSYQLFNFLLIILGAVGVLFMLRQRKIGFHLYVLYSLIPIIGFYLFFPLHLIPTFLVIGSTVIAAVFSVLYGIHLKYMK
jgi:hypothetical protein